MALHRDRMWVDTSSSRDGSDTWPLDATTAEQPQVMGLRL